MKYLKKRILTFLDNSIINLISNSNSENDYSYIIENDIKSNNFFNDFYLQICFLFKYIIKIFKFILSITGIYILWITMHFFASHIYIELCVPKTFYGFLISPLLVATPHCQALRWIVYNGASTINNMWIILGTWICSNLMFFTNNNFSQNNI